MIVEQETKLNYPQQDGSTKRKHLESIAKQTGVMPPELNVPSVPPALLRIKYIFDSLSIGRDWQNGYPCPIGNEDMYYWGKLHDTKLSYWDIRTIRKLDNIQINTIVTLIREQS